MILFVALLGCLITCISLACLISPPFFKRLLATFGHGRRLYWISLFRLLAGICLVIISTQLPTATLISAIGCLFLLSGMIGLILGPRRLQPMVTWWASRSVLTIRLWSLLAMGLGSGLMYAVFNQCHSPWAC